MTSLKFQKKDRGALLHTDHIAHHCAEAVSPSSWRTTEGTDNALFLHGSHLWNGSQEELTTEALRKNVPEVMNNSLSRQY